MLFLHTFAHQSVTKNQITKLFFVVLLLSQFLRRRDSMASFLPDCNNNKNNNKDFGNLVFGH